MIREIKVESKFPAFAAAQIPIAFHGESKPRANTHRQNDVTILCGRE